MSRLALLVVVTLLPTTVSLAQQEAETDPEADVRYLAVTEHEFDDLDVRAQAARPEGIIVFEPGTHSFNPLVRMKLTFDAEMKRSVAEVK